MEVFIFTLMIAVQTREFVVCCNCLSSSLDDEPAAYSSIANCVIEETQICKEKHPRRIPSYEKCIIKAFKKCRDVRKNIKPGDPKQARDPRDAKLLRCIDTCLYDWHEKPVRKKKGHYGVPQHFLHIPSCLQHCLQQHLNERDHPKQSRDP
ncbi:hypothetical protein CJ030_MR1G023804 [Morella rubra]|uniref:Uncharacterized protein n=1 Tax=Morella rubra TaxID=262757 RepID=A0A6A1WXU4_9ROSI|nr:hypothetical protein CJ030_MR1G023804 [Morella rubra]